MELHTDVTTRKIALNIMYAQHMKHVFLLIPLSLSSVQASSPGDNTTCTRIASERYIQITLFDHITRRKA